MSREEREPFLAAAAGEASMREWADGDRTIYKHAEERTVFVTDWFADHLTAGSWEERP